MLYWAITFLIIALIAAVLGFGGIAGTAVGIAKILFFILLVLLVLCAGLRPAHASGDVTDAQWQAQDPGPSVFTPPAGRGG